MLILDLNTPLGRGGCLKTSQNPGTAKISLTRPNPGFDDQKRVNATYDKARKSTYFGVKIYIFGKMLTN